MALFDVNEAQKAAEAEVREEAIKDAKNKIKASLKKISAAEEVVANLKREHAVLLNTIGE